MAPQQRLLQKKPSRISSDEPRCTQFTTVEQSVLRLSTEPFEYFDEQAVHAALTSDPCGYYGHVKKQLQRIALGQAELKMPPKQLFADPGSGGDCRVMPCIVRDGDQVLKTVKLIGTNARQQIVPNQITVGKACVFHPVENYISHIFEACLLSSARTAICAVLAIDLLGRSRQQLTLIGAGRVGFYTGLYAAALGFTRHITVHDVDQPRAESCAEALRLRFPAITVSVSQRNELKDTDNLVLSTTSRKPVYGVNDFNAELVISLGADTDYQRELDDLWASNSSIFVDTKDSARYGDLRNWLQSDLISKDELTDLFTLLSSQKQPSGEKTRVFVSTGTALFDNLTIGYLLEKNEHEQY